MKQFKVVVLIAILALFSADTFAAGWFQDWRSSRQQRQIRRYEYRHHQGGGTCPGTPVGAPIDGGLLTILGAAGVTYYVAKKNKKEKA